MVLVAVVAAVALGSSAGPAAASHVDCGEVLKKNTTLDRDLTGCRGNGLVIRRSGITVDLNGHRVTGSDAGVGIDVSRGHDRIRILDGELAGFRTAVVLAGSAKSSVRRIRVSDTGGGIALRRSGRNVIADNRLNTRFTAVGLLGSNDNRIEGNVLVGDAALTVAGSDRNLVKRNSVPGGGHGMRLLDSDHSVVEENAVARTARDGIVVTNGSTILRRNTATHNGELGINAVAGATDGGGNRAFGNGGESQCTGVACSG